MLEKLKYIIKISFTCSLLSNVAARTWELTRVASGTSTGRCRNPLSSGAARRSVPLLFCPCRSHLHSQSAVAVIGGEEHFEDYGEGSEAELSLETLCNGEHGRRDPAFLTPR